MIGRYTQDSIAAAYPRLEDLRELLDTLQWRLLELAGRGADDPDFVRIWRGVQTLSKVDELFRTRRADRERISRERGSGPRTSLETMAPFDADSLARLDRDAVRLRVVEGRADQPSQDAPPARGSAAAQRDANPGTREGGETVGDPGEMCGAVPGEPGASAGLGEDRIVSGGDRIFPGRPVSARSGLLSSVAIVANDRGHPPDRDISDGGGEAIP